METQVVEVGFGGWLRQRRRDLDLTQRELADRVGCSFETIRSIEAHRSRPSKQIAERIAAELKISQGQLAAFVDAARRGTRPGSQPERPAAPAAAIDLPAPRTALVGRERDTAVVVERLLGQYVRLLTLVGPPGIGKTRLSISAAEHMAHAFQDGVTFIELAPVQQSELIMASIGRGLGLQESGASSFDLAVEGFLKEKQLLLVLDNFEHVLEAAPLLGKLLLGAPGLKVLATSRERLNIYGEHVYEVPALDTPDAEHLHKLHDLQQVASVRLFVERAQAARFDFHLTEVNASAIATICQRLEGMPLALELAAARMQVSSPQQIVDALTDQLALLETRSRDLPARQRTMRGALEWSYALLETSEQRLLRGLSIFVGGFTVEAVRAVFAHTRDASTQIEAHLSSLIEKSLVTRLRVEPDLRLSMFEVIREYARGEADARGELAQLEAAHANNFLAFAEQAESELIGGDQLIWMQRLEEEHANLREALTRFAESGEVEKVGRLSAALWRFWITRGFLHEGLLWLETALAQADALTETTHARLLNGAGSLARDMGQYDRAQAFHEACLELRQRLGDELGAASSTNNLANVALDVADYERARGLYESSLAYFRTCNDEWRMAIALNGIGLIARQQGDYDAAATAYEECLNLRRKRNDEWGIALAVTNLGEVARDRRQLQQAVEYFRDSLNRFRRLGDRKYVAMTLEGLATVFLLEGNGVRAATLLGAADALRELIAAPVRRADRAEYAAWIEAARSLLGDRKFTTAWLTGRAMPMERAMVLAADAR